MISVYDCVKEVELALFGCTKASDERMLQEGETKNEYKTEEVGESKEGDVLGEEVALDVYEGCL